MEAEMLKVFTELFYPYRKISYYKQKIKPLVFQLILLYYQITFNIINFNLQLR